MSPKVVAGTVAAEAEYPEVPGWEPFEELGTGERKLIADALEAEAAIVSAGMNSWD